jgi:hypothetical protein
VVSDIRVATRTEEPSIVADLIISQTAVRHLAYHSRMAAAFGAAGNVDECASEALLAWSILASHGETDIIDALTGDLPEPETLVATPEAQDAARRRAYALALVQGLRERRPDRQRHPYEQVASSLRLP